MSDYTDDPFLNERDPSPGPDSPGWIIGPGGGGGGGGGIPWWINPSDPDGPAWITDDACPLLRKNSRTFLRRDSRGFLFSGTRKCVTAPNLIVRPGPFPENDPHDHFYCLLFRLSGDLLTLTMAGSDEQRWAYALSGELVPGDYTLSARWQAGHYDYGKVRSVRLLLFGIDFGNVTLPLSGYADLAGITVFGSGEVSVNHLKGFSGGNLKFFS